MQVQRELRTQSMDPNEPIILVRGIDKVIKKDLQKHLALLDKSKVELLAYKEARSHEIKKKKYYRSLIGGDKYDDHALKNSMAQIAVNIRHMSDKIKLTQEAIAHHTLIVDTLTKQLEDYNETLNALASSRSYNGTAN